MTVKNTTPDVKNPTLPAQLDAVRRHEIEKALYRKKGNKKHTATWLGVSLRTFMNWMKEESPWNEFKNDAEFKKHYARKP